MSSCSNSGVRSCTKIVSFSGSLRRAIAEHIYIKTIEIENVICCGVLLFLRLRDPSRWAKLEISL
jgi:heterodisulfide reductase subunit B